MEELLRELYHSLRFSNEETSSSHDDEDAHGNHHRKQPSFDLLDGKKGNLLDAKSKKIKSFTFEKSHMKLSFWRNDELMLNEVHKMVTQRLAVTKKNIFVADGDGVFA